MKDVTKIKDLFWTAPELRCDGEDSIEFGRSELGTFSVLDRLTGFGWRDVETGFRSWDGKEWYLVSGNFDIRDFPELTVQEAYVKMKELSSY